MPRNDRKWEVHETLRGPKPHPTHGKGTAVCLIFKSDDYTPRYSYQLGFEFEPGSVVSARTIPHQRADEFADLLDDAIEKVSKLKAQEE